MADRKARSVTFRTPERIGLGVMKEGIQKEIQDGIVVFQELGDNVYLLELQSRGDAELLVDNGFDVNEFHIDCSPPHGKFVNVSIMGLRSYVEDEEVKSVLSEYGELKSEVIRLKYKADHELAGFENGNRLVKIILEKPSIPYSLRIGGEWCRIIHNNQQPVCIECNELGHTKRNCPKIRCRVCKQLGHISYNCDLQEDKTDETPDGHADDQESEQNHREQPVAASVDPSNEAGPADVGPSANNNNNNNTEFNDGMDYDDRGQSCKRQLTTDSDSDRSASTRRTRLRPAPSLSTRRKVEKNTKATKGSDKPPSK